jgi:hypothetical protein
VHVGEHGRDTTEAELGRLFEPFDRPVQGVFRREMRRQVAKHGDGSDDREHGTDRDREMDATDEGLVGAGDERAPRGAGELRCGLQRARERRARRGLSASGQRGDRRLQCMSEV